MVILTIILNKLFRHARIAITTQILQAIPTTFVHHKTARLMKSIAMENAKPSSALDTYLDLYKMKTPAAPTLLALAHLTKR